MTVTAQSGQCWGGEGPEHCGSQEEMLEAALLGRGNSTCKGGKRPKVQVEEGEESGR